MHRTLRSARPAAALTLALGAALVLPGAAFAGTTGPTPTTTTGAPAPSTTTSTTTPDPVTTTGTPATNTTSASPSGTTASSSTTASSRTTKGASSDGTAGLVAGGDASRYGLLAAPAGPATTTDPALAAAGFLERELAAGGHHLSQVFGAETYADYGLTLDAVLALDAAGAGQSEATAATAYVADHVGEYIGPAYGDTELWAGATAKTLLVAVAQGVDPTAFGGIDLVASLQSLRQPSGRFTDKSAGTDYSNLIGQSLAVMALRRAGQALPASTTDIIRANQCADGGFSLAFAASPCASDPDVTAFAVQALLAVGGIADTDAQEGLGYLASRQGADGGIGGSGPTAATNANSTGLAGQAFLAGGRVAQARAAQAYLRGLQHGCEYAAAFHGAIAYDRNARTGNLVAGATVSDQERRTTAQAVLALAGTPLYAVSASGADATAPDLACAAPTSTTSPSTTPATTTTSSTSTTTTSAVAIPTSGDPAGDSAASATPGNLALTGANVAVMVLLALVLLLLGAAALVVARRKGVHA